MPHESTCSVANALKENIVQHSVQLNSWNYESVMELLWIYRHRTLCKILALPNPVNMPSPFLLLFNCTGLVINVIHQLQGVLELTVSRTPDRHTKDLDALENISVLSDASTTLLLQCSKCHSGSKELRDSA